MSLSSLECVYKTFTEVEKKTNYSDKKKYIYLLKRNANEPVTRFWVLYINKFSKR